MLCSITLKITIICQCVISWIFDYLTDRLQYGWLIGVLSCFLYERWCTSRQFSQPFCSRCIQLAVEALELCPLVKFEAYYLFAFNVLYNSCLLSSRLDGLMLHVILNE